VGGSVKAFWCALLAVVALASDARADVLTLKLAPATRYSLANGLRVVLQEDHRLPRVAVHVAYRVGSADDRPGYAGLAHLVEHLTFRGSRHVPALVLGPPEYIGPELADLGALRLYRSVMTQE
jgi:zinc protease